MLNSHLGYTSDTRRLLIIILQRHFLQVKICLFFVKTYENNFIYNTPKNISLTSNHLFIYLLSFFETSAKSFFNASIDLVNILLASICPKDSNAIIISLFVFTSIFFCIFLQSPRINLLSLLLYHLLQYIYLLFALFLYLD